MPHPQATLGVQVEYMHEERRAATTDFLRPTPDRLMSAIGTQRTCERTSPTPASAPKRTSMRVNRREPLALEFGMI